MTQRQNEFGQPIGPAVEGWSPRAHVQASPALCGVLGALRDGTFSHHEPERWHGLVHQLLHHDPY